MGEPATTAKVILHTEKGRLDIELWAKECPITCRNFLTNCINGKFNGLTFYKVIKDYAVQTGDYHNGDGTAQKAIVNYPQDEDMLFKDEFNSRLRFNKRGMLGSAKSDGGHSKSDGKNGNQFFITLKATPELNGKNTVFGKVVGDSVFTVVRIADCELEEGSDDRPMYPAKIVQSEVVVPYFEDLAIFGDGGGGGDDDDDDKEPSKKKQKVGEPKTVSKFKDRKKKKAKVKLSFDDEDEEGNDDEDDNSGNIKASRSKSKKFKIKSAHETLKDKSLARGKIQLAKDDSIATANANASANGGDHPENENGSNHNNESNKEGNRDTNDISNGQRGNGEAKLIKTESNNNSEGKNNQREALQKEIDALRHGLATDHSSSGGSGARNSGSRNSALSMSEIERERARLGAHHQTFSGGSGSGSGSAKLREIQVAGVIERFERKIAAVLTLGKSEVAAEAEAEAEATKATKAARAVEKEEEEAESDEDSDTGLDFMSHRLDFSEGT